MTDDEIMTEIRSVFSDAMGGHSDRAFRFNIMQSSGGGSKTISAPSMSSSFRWTAQGVAGSSKTPIYILAIDNLKDGLY